MNHVILMGRLTKDPDVRYTQGQEPMCIARYTLAVDRRFSRNNNNGNNADFIPCVCFGRQAEFVEKYLIKGTKMAVTGRIQTGSYTNKDGVKVYTTEVVVEDQEIGGIDSFKNILMPEGMDAGHFTAEGFFSELLRTGPVVEVLRAHFLQARISGQQFFPHAAVVSHIDVNCRVFLPDGRQQVAGRKKMDSWIFRTEWMKIWT